MKRWKWTRFAKEIENEQPNRRGNHNQPERNGSVERSGHKVVREYFRLIGMPIPTEWTGLEIELPIWELANLFGPHLYNGCHPPFESMNVELRRM